LRARPNPALPEAARRPAGAGLDTILPKKHILVEEEWRLLSSRFFATGRGREMEAGG
jgi:hypothetical protein